MAIGPAHLKLLADIPHLRAVDVRNLYVLIGVKGLCQLAPGLHVTNEPVKCKEHADRSE